MIAEKKTSGNNGDLVGRIKSTMETSNIRSSELAIKSGIPLSSISSLLNGRVATPGAHALASIARVLGVSSDWLVFGTGNKQSASLPDEAAEVKKANEYVVVLSYNVKAGCGEAFEPSWEECNDVKPVYLHKSFFVNHNFNPDNIKIIDAVGDSMEPTISSGDKILIDTSPIYQIEDGRIYAFFDGGFFKIKRLRTIRGGVEVHSDNPVYKDDHIVGDDFQNSFKIIGRVVYRCGCI